MKKYLLASMGSHYFQQGYGTDEIIVIIKQGLLHAFTHSLQSSKMNNSIKSEQQNDIRNSYKFYFILAAKGELIVARQHINLQS